MKKAVVLYSGGLDSTTVLAMAKADGFTPYALSFSYGQRHNFELEQAKKNASQVGAVEHKIVDIDLRLFGGSALTDDIEVPKGRDIDSSIPVTYVPARNTIFLSYALAYAEVLSAHDIFIGVNALDYSGYPDCRPEYISAYERMANLATKLAVESDDTFRIRTPLIDMSKAEIVKMGISLGVDFGLTHSCYDPTATGLSCGVCDSCVLRLKGFAEAGLTDPLKYVGDSHA
jgi:7-cyano-7-deazaguanine synthase